MILIYLVFRLVRRIHDNIILITVNQSVLPLLHRHCLYDAMRTYLHRLFVEHDPYRRIEDSSSEQSDAIDGTPLLTYCFVYPDVSPLSECYTR
ncbi:hypothetical protein H5410_036344 [Solanum commersonii]|uniref:Uncharacterized protein n=1 Tax=Solanum commersonii TaxID=4109 RepID=A0A9J5Y682_SOLCO|nr:hypothetical protein H5410_036344 [Solanum commersonii]